MDFEHALISTGWLWFFTILYILILAFVLYRIPWHKLSDHNNLNIWLGACVALILIWMMRAEVNVGAHLHFMGATLMTLMFGWHYAILGLTLVTISITLTGHGDWISLGTNAILFSVLPASISYLCFLLVEWKLPKNFFIYIFLTAFGGAILSVTLVAVTTSLFLQLATNLSWSELTNGYLQYFLMLAYPEGFITGLLMTVFVIYRPAWVYTFRDNKYLTDE